MASFNQLQLIGRLGKDPETRYTTQGTGITHFSVATSEKRDGEERTEWHDIVTFGKTAEFCAQYLGKGREVFFIAPAVGLVARGRLFVADRANNRTMIFDQDGKFIADWRQFGRPSGFYISGDRLYAIDADSSEANHPGGWKKGVWIGSIREGRAEAFVPDDTAGEGVVIAPDGNMYGAVNVAPRGITRYQKK